MKRIHHFLQIPIDITHLTLREKFFRPLQVYIFLKSRCSGQLKISKSEIREVSSKLGTSADTIKRNLKKLRERNWVGYNPESGYYFIRGFKKIKQLEGSKYLTSVCLSVDRELCDFRIFKAFLYGASIGYLARYQKGKARRRAGSERTKGSSKHNPELRLPTHYPVACEAMSKIFGISISTAHKYKKEADEHGFIDLRNNFNMVKKIPKDDEVKRNILSLGPGVDAKEIPFLKEGYPEIAQRIRPYKEKAYSQDPDTVCPKLTYKRTRRSGRS